MDSLHGDICGPALDDLHVVYYPTATVPEKHRHVLCDKCKKANPKKKHELCRKCARAIARLLGGGHTSTSTTSSYKSESSSDDSEASTFSSSSTASRSEGPGGYLVVGEKVNAAPSSSCAWEARLSQQTSSQTPIPGRRTRVVSRSQPEADVRATYAQQQQQQQRRRRQQIQAQQEKERELQARRAEEARARELAKYQAWLSKRRTHRNWQNRMLQTFKLRGDPDGTKGQEFLRNSVPTCECHGDPDCRVLVAQEYKIHLALEEADRAYRATAHGRGMVSGGWVPVLGPQGRKFWVERELPYLNRLTRPQPARHTCHNKDGRSTCMSVGWRLEAERRDILLSGPREKDQDGRRLELELGDMVGLWRMEVVLGNVWGRVPDARWRVRRMEPPHEEDEHDASPQSLGSIWLLRAVTFWRDAESETEKENREALSRLRDVERDKVERPKLDEENFKGCMLFERNPCWALLPLLPHDGGDVGLVWRWERVVFENPPVWPFGNPFAWLWRVCVRMFPGTIGLWKWLGRWVGLRTAEEEDGELD